jgi:hypothetical protein
MFGQVAFARRCGGFGARGMRPGGLNVTVTEVVAGSTIVGAKIAAPDALCGAALVFAPCETATA